MRHGRRRAPPQPPELAEYLGVPVATLYAWRYRGEGPRGFRIGKHLRYRWSDVEAWIEGQLEDDRPRPGALSHPRGRVAQRGPSRPRETDRRCHERAVPWIGEVPLSRLTPELLRQMLSELIASGYAPETVAKTMRWVRLTLNQAVRDRRLVSSPAQGIRLPKPRRTEMRLLDPDQVVTLAEALPDRYGSLPIVAAYTGLRWGELAGLQVANLDFLRRRLRVGSALVEASGEPPRLSAPKSSASERTITLPQVVLEPLARHLEVYPPTDGMVWTTPRGGFLRRGGSGGRRWQTRWGRPVGSTTCGTPTPPG